MESVLIRCRNCNAVNRVKTEKFRNKPVCAACKNLLTWPSVPIDITLHSYQKEVSENPGYTLVEFWSPTCGYCRAMDPLLNHIAQELPGIIKIAKINTATETVLASQFTIMGVPTFILFKGGKMIDQVNGAMEHNRFRTWVEHHLS